jgi:hypothetical protein
MEKLMSQLPEDRETTRAQRDAPSRMTVGGTSGPTVGGEPAMPGTREFEREVDQTTGKTPLGLSTALLWTVGILLVAAVLLILFFAL